MKTKRFIIFRNVFFILMALVLVGGLTAGWRAATRPSTAELRVTNLVISPAEVYVGEQTAIFAEVTNNGDSDDTHTIVLTVNNSNGQEVEKGETEVPVPAGKMTTVEFAITLNIPDTYKIEVDGWTGTLEVMERPTGAEFRVIGLAITPPTVEVGEMVIVSATIENIGQTDGTYIPTLKIDGTEIEEKPEVPVAAGGTATVEFTLAINVAGTYEIEVDGQRDFLEVTAP